MNLVICQYYVDATILFFIIGHYMTLVIITHQASDDYLGVNITLIWNKWLRRMNTDSKYFERITSLIKFIGKQSKFGGGVSTTPHFLIMMQLLLHWNLHEKCIPTMPWLKDGIELDYICVNTLHTTIDKTKLVEGSSPPPTFLNMLL